MATITYIEFDGTEHPQQVETGWSVMEGAVKNGVTPASHAYQEGPRYASLKGIMAAKKKPLEAKTMSDLGVVAKPVVRQTGIELPPPRVAGRKVADVAELVRLLRDEAKAL